MKNNGKVLTFTRLTFVKLTKQKVLEFYADFKTLKIHY